jgi:Tol biopolymer transport system component
VHSSLRRFLAAALATIAALAAFGASSALAAPNEIAYRCDLDICLLDPDSPSAVTNLTDNGNVSFDEKPEWSPNGSRLAFVSNFSNGTQNIFVMDPGAAGEGINLATQVTHYTVNNAVITDLAWSPDGSRIAFTRGTNAGNDGAFVVAADGTSAEARTIAAPGQGEHPTWSPDGGKIAYGRTSNERIYVASSSGGSGAELANGVGHSPTWSPDGSKIALDTYNSVAFVDLHIVNADGSGTPAVVPDGFSEWTYATWSATGARIAYFRRNPEGFDHVWVVNADGSGDHAVENLQN